MKTIIIVILLATVYSPPLVDRIWGIWGSYHNVPKAIFYLLKGGLYPFILGPQLHCRPFPHESITALKVTVSGLRLRLRKCETSKGANGIIRHIYIYIYICIHLCVGVYIYTYVYICIHIYVYIYTHVYTHMYIHKCIYSHVYTYVCIYMYIILWL